MNKAADAPCKACGYNGPQFYQANIHTCAAEFHRSGKWMKPEDVPPIARAASQLRAISVYRRSRKAESPTLTQAQAQLLWNERYELHELVAKLSVHGTRVDQATRQRIKKVLEER